MKLVLQITEDWRLRADRFCYALERRVLPRSVQGRAEAAERWKAAGYYTRPHAALRALWHSEARLISAASVEELAQAYRDAGELISAKLLPLTACHDRGQAATG